jgi:hypothetical protein
LRKTKTYTPFKRNKYTSSLRDANKYAVNGDLTEFINYLGALCEPDARRLFKQLLEIVSYIHENNICHRHITCDNILLDENWPLYTGLTVCGTQCIFVGFTFVTSPA